MKKLLSIMIGLGLILGTATVSFGKEKPADDTTKKKKKKKKEIR